MQSLHWEKRPYSLRKPALVCAFTGWNDAGECASAALSYLGSQLKARRFATIDADEYVDYQSARPAIKLTEKGDRELSWPDFELYEARVPEAERDFVLLSGPEPAIRWRAFSEQIIELADILAVERVVILGSLLADVAHTRPVGLTGHASDHELLERLGLDVPNYQGPTGIVGVLYTAFANAGFAAASVWAAVPHYVAVSPNPKGALALLRKVERLVDIDIDTIELEEAAIEHELQVSRAVELDPDIRAFVEQLENASDQQTSDRLLADPLSLTSGEALAKEFQQFLRDRDNN